jgi:acetylglutamate kinase
LDTLTIVKVGGKILETPATLAQLLTDFAAIDGKKILVHGGGRSATAMASRLGVETTMIDGRRVTDDSMLEIVTMVYGGLVNKGVVAGLQARGVNALGVTGADMNIIRSHRRPATPVADFGWVGDVDSVNDLGLQAIINAGATPVIAPLTHDGQGHLLNTNADTMASVTAVAMAHHYDVRLVYCFEKPGVLADENDDNSVIPAINRDSFDRLLADAVVTGGMIPKLQNALDAVDNHVGEVIITQASALNDLTRGTHITR